MNANVSNCSIFLAVKTCFTRAAIFPVEEHLMSLCHVETYKLMAASTFITCIMHIHMINHYHYANTHNYTTVNDVHECLVMHVL